MANYQLSIMKIIMTRNTNRNNIKPVFTRIALVVMVFFCVIAAINTIQCVRPWYFSVYNSTVHNSACFHSLWITEAICLRASVFALFAFYGFVIFTIYLVTYNFTLFCGPVFGESFIATWLTLIFMAKFARFIFVKFTKQFNGFACRAFSCYILFRHGFFLIKKLCLEPLQTQYLCGLLYYNTNGGDVK